MKANSYTYYLSYKALRYLHYNHGRVIIIYQWISFKLKVLRIFGTTFNDERKLKVFWISGTQSFTKQASKLIKIIFKNNNKAWIKMKALLERIFHKLSHVHIKLMIL